jgi:hypothetical protein
LVFTTRVGHQRCRGNQQEQFVTGDYGFGACGALRAGRVNTSINYLHPDIPILKQAKAEYAKLQ